MKLLFSCAAAALMAAIPAAPASAEPDKEKSEKVICKSEDRPALGSNMRKRKKTCMTESDWKALERLNEEAKRDMMRGGGNDRPPVGGFGTGG